MSCYNPKIRIEDISKWTRAADGHYYHPAIVIGEEQKNDLETLQKYSAGHYKKVVIPCRNCIGCKLDNSRQWANRGFLQNEIVEPGTSWFVTLTYDENHLIIPEYMDVDDYIFDRQTDWKGVLIPKDVKNFIQNLRRKCPKDNIKYMMAGEYGTKGERPHYHLIIYGLHLPYYDLYSPRIINKNIYYQSHIIEECWIQEDECRKKISRGISNVSEVSWNNIAYTARYITKKINGAGSELYYASKGQIKEFFRVSNRPGIGYDYYQKYKDKIYENDEIVIKNLEGIIHSKPPKYFDQLFEAEYPEKMKEIKEKRERASNNAQILKDLETTLLRRERLKVEERAKLKQSNMLRRTLEGH